MSLYDSWAWIKSLRWIVTAGMVLTAILMVLAGARSVKKKRSANIKEDKVTELMKTNIKFNLRESNALITSAAIDKQKAAKAKKFAIAQLKKLGEANEDINVIADRFNSRRVRKSG